MKGKYTLFLLVVRFPYGLRRAFKMSLVLEYLKETDHLKVWFSETQRRVENLASNFLKTDTYGTETYGKVIEGFVRFRWMDFLGEIKIGKLDKVELIVGEQIFEYFYQR